MFLYCIYTQFVFGNKKTNKHVLITLEEIYTTNKLSTEKEDKIRGIRNNSKKVFLSL